MLGLMVLIAWMRGLIKKCLFIFFITDNITMKLFKNEDRFIKQMIEETYKFLPDCSAYREESVSRQHPNNEKKTSVEDELGPIINEDINLIPLKYLDNICCFRTSLKGKTLDLPANWSVFKDLRSSIVKGKIFSVMIRPDSENGHLYKVLNAFFSRKNSVLTFLVCNGKAYLLMLKSTNTNSLELINKKKIA